VRPAKEKSSVPLKAEFRALVKNKYAMITCALAFFIYVGIGLGAVNIYFAVNVLGSAATMGILMVTWLGPKLPGYLLLPQVIRKIGKRNAGICGSVGMIIGQLIMCSAPSVLTVVLIGATVRAFSAAGLFGTIFALGADTIEYGEWKSGVRTEGLISAAVSASTKLGAGIGLVLVGWVLGLCGYAGGAATQSASVIAAIKALFLFVPLGLFVSQIALLWFYRLDGEYPQIVRELRARGAQQASD
jgi:GPH family glycoside/pentoside/hexuronide:cation symporter